MNFFRHQEQARRNTVWLVILFALATGAVVLTTNLLFVALIALSGSSDSDPHAPSAWEVYTGEHWLVVSLTTLAVILICSTFRQMSLRHGRDVANALGGRLLDPGTSDLKERRLLNVVEEMSIASGMPVPDIYILEDDGINAFAAGYQPSDAVIGVTRGTVNSLNREQLQGVIAHEFSHIFNGDMRMNMRLTGILYGILFIAEMGRGLLHRLHYRSSFSRRDGTHPAVYGIAFGLIAIGYTGEFFGRMIKAAVSRQREFLADASAVQFTRNASGISGALKIIGYGAGSRVHSGAAVEMSHFFFGPVMRFRATLFSTHPPLDERIQRVEPGWNGHYLAPDKDPVNFSGPAWEYPASGFVEHPSPTDTATAPVAQAESAGMGEQPQHIDGIEAATINAHSARALVFALLMSPDEATARRQQDHVEKHCGQSAFIETLRLLNLLRRQPQERLPLVERCIPALRRMSVTQYRDMNQALVAMIKTDGRVHLYEWCLYRLLLQYLGTHFGTLPPPRSRNRKLSSVRAEVGVVMAYMAVSGHDTDAERDAAYQAGMGELRMGSVSRQPDHDAGESMRPLNQALRTLTEIRPEGREQLLRALITCVRHDHQITTNERDMIRTFAALLETPLGVFGDETEQLFS
ncbi:MAG: hypothetical protein CSH36_11245 [Thalassolituus sp.]|nr:MAG: hypothetical protein CSH36_11245 [Thalassolituus sp.]